MEMETTMGKIKIRRTWNRNPEEQIVSNLKRKKKQKKSINIPLDITQLTEDDYFEIEREWEEHL